MYIKNLVPRVKRLERLGQLQLNGLLAREEKLHALDLGRGLLPHRQLVHVAIPSLLRCLTDAQGVRLFPCVDSLPHSGEALALCQHLFLCQHGRCRGLKGVLGRARPATSNLSLSLGRARLSLADLGRLPGPCVSGHGTAKRRDTGHRSTLAAASLSPGPGRIIIGARAVAAGARAVAAVSG